MIKKIRAYFQKVAWSLKTRMVFVSVIGALLAIAVYLVLRFLLVTLIDSNYNTYEAREKRELEYVENLQEYIDENGLSSDDTAKLTEWVRNNRYSYLILYKDDEIFFSPELDEGEIESPGVSVDYPTLEEIKEYAAQNDLHALSLKDGTLLASVADFSVYLYYDLADLLGILAGIIVLLVAMVMHFHDITVRISKLADDVSIVSERDMNHKIGKGGRDELSELSHNVERMRSSLIENIEKEKKAQTANTELITSMSHDIRTPLTVLLGYLDIMKNNAKDDEMKEYISASEATALRLKTLSDDMFKYFLAFGGGKIDVELENYDAKTLVSQLLAEHSLLLGEQGYTLEYRGGDDVYDGIMINTDAPKAMRIIDNIFSNISKYADAQKPILISVKRKFDKLHISIENHIAKENKKVESSGVGLKTCEKLAEALGIYFAHESEGGKFLVEIGFSIVEVA